MSYESNGGYYVRVFCQIKPNAEWKEMWPLAVKSMIDYTMMQLIHNTYYVPQDTLELLQISCSAAFGSLLDTTEVHSVAYAIHRKEGK